MENTKDYILDIVAPIFNKHGYVGTSMSEITKATQLTKGAIYGNFKNKEELAQLAFERNVEIAIFPLVAQLAGLKSASEKLFCITKYYRNYYAIIFPRGGCPILNVGIDAKQNNKKLFQASQKLAKGIVYSLAQIIEDGIKAKDFRDDIDAKKFASLIYSMIEGAVFMAVFNSDEKYLMDMMDHIDDTIRTRILI